VGCNNSVVASSATQVEDQCISGLPAAGPARTMGESFVLGNYSGFLSAFCVVVFCILMFLLEVLSLSIFGDLCFEQEEGHHQMKALYCITGKHPTPFLISVSNVKYNV
jgi:hypothetical protein